jgi:hypothetical protein
MNWGFTGSWSPGSLGWLISLDQSPPGLLLERRQHECAAINSQAMDRRRGLSASQPSEAKHTCSGHSEKARSLHRCGLCQSLSRRAFAETCAGKGSACLSQSLNAPSGAGLVSVVRLALFGLGITLAQSGMATKRLKSSGPLCRLSHLRRRLIEEVDLGLPA